VNLLQHLLNPFLSTVLFRHEWQVQIVNYERDYRYSGHASLDLPAMSNQIQSYHCHWWIFGRCQEFLDQTCNLKRKAKCEEREKAVKRRKMDDDFTPNQGYSEALKDIEVSSCFLDHVEEKVQYKCISQYLIHTGNAAEGSTILLASRTILGECCLAAIQPKGFWTKLRAQERESVCVCVCEREREREGK